MKDLIFKVLGSGFRVSGLGGRVEGRPMSSSPPLRPGSFSSGPVVRGFWLTVEGAGSV